MKKFLKGLVIFFVGIVVLGQVLQELQPPPTPEEKAAQARSAARWEAEYRAKQAVLGMLREPESAKFGDVWVAKSARVVCGEVNARNGFGGMTGMQRFVIGPAIGLHMEGQQDPEFRTQWNGECVTQSGKDPDAAQAPEVPSGKREVTAEQRRQIMKDLSPEERRELARLTGDK